MREERKGPRVGAPEAAVQGFLKSAGLASLDQAKIETDPKKGEFYVAVIERPGRDDPRHAGRDPAADHPQLPLAEIHALGRGLGAARRLALGAPAAIDRRAPSAPRPRTPEVVPFAVDGIAAGDHHLRPSLPGARRRSEVRRFDDYVQALERAKVVLDAERRKEIILHDARDLAFARGLELVEDEGLLEEVAGLVEWPVVLMGAFDEAFLDIPGGGDPRHDPRQPEMLRAARSAGTDTLANRLHPDSNLVASDGGAAIIAGNERVIRARLSDAQVLLGDRPGDASLEDRLRRSSSSIVFHEKLGTQGERVERIAALARELAPLVGADPDLAERAARLAKADLVTEMVGEFPELQGLMGRYYAALQGEDPSVAAAIEEHYKPRRPDRPCADRTGVGRGGAGRQARHAGRLLGDRREADRQQGSLCAAARGAGRDPPHRCENIG